MLNPDLINDYNATRETPDKSLLCHAPFTSINFEQNGNARACCYNRMHLLGKYPENSLEEIWFGAKADELRDYIQNNDLGGGCTECQRLLESRNFYGTRARHFDKYPDPKKPPSFWDKFRKPTFKKMPKLMEFELSNVCNLECVMCNGYFSSSIRKNRENLPPLTSPYNEAFVEQLVPFLPHLTDAKFLGGEPFLIDIYYSIWEKIRTINPDITVHITTNGTILNNRAKELVESMRCGMIMSIDSIQKDTYEKIRKNASYEKVMENIAYFLDYSRRKKMWMSFAVCPMTLNWKEIPNLVQYCNEHGISIFFNSVIDPPELTLRFLSKKELEDIHAIYSQHSFDTHTDSSTYNYNLKCFRDLTRQIENWANEKADAPLDSSNENKTEEIISKAFKKALNLQLMPSLESDSTKDVMFRELIRYATYKKEDALSRFVPNVYPDKYEVIIFPDGERRKFPLTSGSPFINDYFQALLNFDQLQIDKKDVNLQQNIDYLIHLINTTFQDKPDIFGALMRNDPVFLCDFIRNLGKENMQEELSKISHFYHSLQ